MDTGQEGRQSELPRRAVWLAARRVALMEVGCLYALSGGRWCKDAQPRRAVRPERAYWCRVCRLLAEMPDGPVGDDGRPDGPSGWPAPGQG